MLRSRLIDSNVQALLAGGASRRPVLNLLSREATDVAEVLFTAGARHVVTSLVLLDEDVATRADLIVDASGLSSDLLFSSFVSRLSLIMEAVSLLEGSLSGLVRLGSALQASHILPSSCHDCVPCCE